MRIDRPDYAQERRDEYKERRFQAACAVLQGLYAALNSTGSAALFTEIAVRQADDLLKRLEKSND